jgi:hypothetical protein
MLREERFVIALREDKIRVALHLLNSTQDIDRLLFAMAKAWKDARHDAHLGRLGRERGKLLCGKVDDEISVDQGKLATRHVAIELPLCLKLRSAILAAFEES